RQRRTRQGRSAGGRHLAGADHDRRRPGDRHSHTGRASLLPAPCRDSGRGDGAGSAEAGGSRLWPARQRELGGMNLRPRGREQVDINMAPFIDVVFLLLIFFMVSTTFLKEGSLELSLPEASPPPAEARVEALELQI